MRKIRLYNFRNILNYFYFKRVYINSLTWNRDSCGLFDYESDNFSKNKLKTTGNAKIVRTKNDIHLLQDNYANNLDSYKVLGYIRKEKSKANFI
jgi:hypothetical protein